MEQGKWIQLMPHVSYLEFQQQTDRPNLGYIFGKKQELMVDAGNSAAHVQQYMQALQAQAAMPPSYTAITHWHWDHTFGMWALRAQTIVTRQTDAKLRSIRRWVWTDAAMKKRLASGEEIEFCDTHIRKEYPNLSEIRVKMADVVISGEKLLDLGGITCRLLPVDSPHSRDAMLIQVMEEGVLFGGDADGEDVYEGGGQYDKDRLGKYIRLLQELDFEIYVPGHWHPCTKRQEIEYLQEIYEKLK